MTKRNLPATEKRESHFFSMNNQEISATASKGSDKAGPARSEESTATQPLSPKEAVIRVVSSWEGVSVHEHRFGGVEFRVGRRELGHLHPTFADLPFPRKIRDELIAARRASPHHVLPNSGWVTVPMRTAAEASDVIELFRQNYGRSKAVG